MNSSIKGFLSFLFLISTLSFPQTNGVVFLNPDSLKMMTDSDDQNGQTIYGYWKYNSEDNKLFASPAYDDSGWDSLTSVFFFDSLKNNTRNGIAWFRLKLITDSSLVNKEIALLLWQMGSSEIYLDGKLIAANGKINGKGYNPQNNPVPIKLADKTDYTLAVRFSYNEFLEFYNTLGDFAAATTGFILSFADLKQAIAAKVESVNINTTIMMSLFGIFISFWLLHLLIFLHYKNQKGNLHFSLFSFFLSLVFLGASLSEYLNDPVLLKINEMSYIISMVLTFIFFLSFLYTVFYPKIPVQFWIISSAALLIFIVSFFNRFLGGIDFLEIAILILISIILLEGLRIIIHAIRLGIDGAWIIGSGAVMFILLIAFAFIIRLLDLQLNISLTAATIINYLGFVLLPVSMSVYLARNFAWTNKKLAGKLLEVEELSKKAIENEKKNTELRLESEREKAKLIEAELSSKAAYAEAQAAYAQARALEIENERKTKELEDARELQLSMLPRVIPSLPSLMIAAHMQTATEVGGDYYDFSVGDDNTLTVAIGDATGHGVRAGVMVTAVKSLFVQNSEMNLIEMMENFSASLLKLKFEKLFMCLSVLRIKDNKIKYINAGMPPLLIFRRKYNEVQELKIRALPLGSKLQLPYEYREMQLDSGDVILMMSDGLPELFNDFNEMFDYEKVKDVFHKSAYKSPIEIIESLNEDAESWAGNRIPEDDITFVVIKIK